MAETSPNLQTEVYTAAVDLSAHQYNIMYISDGAQKINVASEAPRNSIVGVLQNKPAAAGRFASVGYAGRGKVRAGAAISSTGAFLTTNGSGRAIAAGSGDMVIGTALETAAADGDIISVQQMKPFRLSGSISV